MFSIDRILIAFAVAAMFSLGQSASAQNKLLRSLPNVRDQLDEHAGFESLPQLVDKSVEVQNLYRSQHLLNQLTQQSRRPKAGHLFVVALEEQEHEKKAQEIRRKMKGLENESRILESKLESANREEEKKLKHELRKLQEIRNELNRELHRHEHGEPHNEPRGDHEDRPEQEGEIHEQMKRVHTLREAAERLEHGGIHDMSHELHQRAGQLEREIEKHRDHRGRQHEDALHEVIKNVQALRREVGELHQKLDQVLKFIDEEQNEDDDL